jgi:hypothetical protein
VKEQSIMYPPLPPTIPSVRNSIGRPPLRRGFVLLALTAFALSPMAQGQLPSPAPDGGYPNGNTAEGDGALFSINTAGLYNTAIGYQALYHDTSGSTNTAIGLEALFNNTTGGQNTAIGVEALFYNTTGQDNTATGRYALLHNTTGSSNTATGEGALLLNTTGINNTATGEGALFSNTTGINNTATGMNALPINTTGNNNTAQGFDALRNNTTGESNTASGGSALQYNTTGGNNTASGYKALQKNTTGRNNAASGVSALQNNTTGSNLTATGVYALINNTTAANNTAHGFSVLNHNTSGTNNTGLGASALLNNTTGGSNIAVGNSAGVNLTTGSNNIDIGHPGATAEGNTIRIGTAGTQTDTYIAGIFNATATNGVSVYVDSNGHLGTLTSSERFKDEIQPMDKASEALLALKPVTFRYKQEIDPKGIPQFGLVAEQVEKVNPDLVARDAEGKVYTVRYEAVNAMLLNEFLKEHRKVEELESTVAAQQKDFQVAVAQEQKEIAALRASLKEQASQIRKVSDQLEESRPAAQVVVADR